MNEKLKSLAEQSGFYFYDLHNVNGEDLGETIEADSWSCAEKFAELIIQECINRIESKRSSGENGDQWTITRDLCYYQMIQELKEHFGVEE